MKILWIKSDFLHPTTKGGHIRTLEMLRRIHQRHEVHYLAYTQPGDTEGVSRSIEYSTRSYPIPHEVPSRKSLAFAWQAAKGLFSSLPVSIDRYATSAMKRKISELVEREHFDSIVCDFLAPAPNIKDLGDCVLFQHNIESIIWERHAATASGLKRVYFARQARLMRRYEEQVCRSVRKVVAVSAVDALGMEERFRMSRVAFIPTGVDVEYFQPCAGAPQMPSDLLFVGSMDWMPNVDGIRFFVKEILPLIRMRVPECTLTIAGRNPPREIATLAERDPGISVTGTVPDIRPYLWGASVSIVPLRIGGGTRIKIYESMAAKAPVVSTEIGAEGLDVHHETDIMIASAPGDFARRCVALLQDKTMRARMARVAFQHVSENFSWEKVAREFEGVLMQSQEHTACEADRVSIEL